MKRPYQKLLFFAILLFIQHEFIRQVALRLYVSDFVDYAILLYFRLLIIFSIAAYLQVFIHLAHLLIRPYSYIKDYCFSIVYTNKQIVYCYRLPRKINYTKPLGIQYCQYLFGLVLSSPFTLQFGKIVDSKLLQYSVGSLIGIVLLYIEKIKNYLSDISKIKDAYHNCNNNLISNINIYEN